MKAYLRESDERADEEEWLVELIRQAKQEVNEVMAQGYSEREENHLTRSELQMG